MHVIIARSVNGYELIDIDNFNLNIMKFQKSISVLKIVKFYFYQ